jgi:hypothetical protein
LTGEYAFFFGVARAGVLTTGAFAAGLFAAVCASDAIGTATKVVAIIARHTESFVKRVSFAISKLRAL